MIGYNEYVTQLNVIYHSGQLQDVSNCEFVKMLPGGDALEARFKYISTPECNINTSVYSLEVLIQYDTTFQEPQLAFRLWQWDHNVYKLYYDLENTPLQTQLPPWFVVNIDLISNEPWYIVGVCDTPEVVGSSALDQEHYMERWMAVYLLHWIHLLPCK